MLKQVLPKATHDPNLAEQIYEAIEHELDRKARIAAFDKYCRKMELPDLEPKTLEDVKRQFDESFRGADVTLMPDLTTQTLAIEIALPDGTQLNSNIEVRPVATELTDEPEIKLKFVPFPVCLPGDQQLVWILAKREDLTSEEAAIAVSKTQEEFWASKRGQKLLRDHVERGFPEFIARAPAGMLSEAGVKRHYKEPEPIKVLHSSTVLERLPGQSAKGEGRSAKGEGQSARGEGRSARGEGQSAKDEVQSGKR
ncbi:MAG: hypothetical protein M1608_03180 [Candidatus Omnitrophica bacterium]|nr:hypothetical protein [Candidatus Omnitrophota bacterium]